jgi:hypothetical protein
MGKDHHILRIAFIALLVLAVIEMLLAGMGTPMSSGDDLALEVNHYFYVEKLHAEGRWFVYAWQRLVGITPRAFDFHLSLALWCASSAVIAALLVRNGVTKWGQVLQYDMARGRLRVKSCQLRGSR